MYKKNFCKSRYMSLLLSKSSSKKSQIHGNIKSFLKKLKRQSSKYSSVWKLATDIIIGQCFFLFLWPDHHHCYHGRLTNNVFILQVCLLPRRHLAAWRPRGPLQRLFKAILMPCASVVTPGIRPPRPRWLWRITTVTWSHNIWNESRGKRRLMAKAGQKMYC